MRRQIFYLIGMFSFLFAHLQGWEPCYYLQPLGKIRVDVGYAVGNFMGIRDDYAEIGAFIPLTSTTNWLIFEDIRAYRLNGSDCACSRWGASAGLGFRIASGCNDRIWGANIYYDYLQSRFHDGFQRIGLGIDWIGPSWDFRINGYIPIDYQKKSSNTIFFDYTAPLSAACTMQEYALSKGFDAEIGIPFACMGYFDYYGAFGIYYFSNPSVDSYVGGQVRFEIGWKFVTLEARGSYDHTNRYCGQAELQVSIPLEVIFSSSDCGPYCKNEFYRPVRRNGIIFTETCCEYVRNFQ